MSDISVLSDQAVRLLSDIGATWPDALLVAPETADLMALRELDYVEQWDMLPNGDRRWTSARTIIGFASGQSRAAAQTPSTATHSIPTTNYAGKATSLNERKTVERNTDFRMRLRPGSSQRDLAGNIWRGRRDGEYD